jgi:predicted RNA-binding protein YlqC (UPF0109 family)
MAKLDDHEILVITEDMDFANEIPTQPREKKLDTTDHVQRKARVLSLSGQVTENSANVQRYLTEASDTGKVIYFVGRTAIRGLISGLKTSRDNKIADGFYFSFTITEVQYADSAYVADLPTPVRTQAAPIVNSGTTPKQPKAKKPKKTTGKKKKKDKKTPAKDNVKKIADGAKAKAATVNKWGK